jgi:hypothetical protein
METLRRRKTIEKGGDVGKDRESREKGRKKIRAKGEKVKEEIR